MTQVETNDVTSSTRTLFGPRVRLVLWSFLMLFLELALIRWAGSEIVHLSYFTNFVLLGSFLGIGIGFLRGTKRRDLTRLAPVALALLALVVYAGATRIPESGAKLLYFGASPGDIGLPVWVVLPAIFLSVAAVMSFVAQGTARAFSKFQPLEAYRWDILGSILGIVAFAVLSFMSAPPIGWGLCATVLFGLLLFPRVRLAAVGCVVLLVVLAVQSFGPDTYYSPYYKVALRDFSGKYNVVMVNNKPSQYVQSTAVSRRQSPVYFTPYATMSPSNVLIIGAGTGNDVAIALGQGARHVDAVEVDPRLVEVGEVIHPNKPYSDERVDVHVDDGRAFLERTDETYDLIMYSLPDSLTLVAGQAGLRLESFLFTEEALQAAKNHLSPGGTFALYGYFPESWMADRMASAMQDVFQRPTCVPIGYVRRVTKLGLARTSIGALAMLVSPGVGTCSPIWQPSGPVLDPPTDDRPFPYLYGTHVPSFYLWTLALILAISLAAVRFAGGPLRQMGRYKDLFFMGAAFLLLETKSVVGFALLFGTTWFVNALVFLGILGVVYAAVAVARRVTLRRPALLYPLLFASLALAWLVPPSALLSLAVVARFVAAVLLTFTPIFLANLIFAERFRGVEASTVAFGANLLGAMLGGVLEYGALLTGYRMLIVLAALLYLLAFAFGHRYLRPPQDVEEGTAPPDADTDPDAAPAPVPAAG